MAKLSRRETRVLAAASIILVGVLLVIVVAPRVSDFLTGNTTVRVRMTVSYQGSWNGTYYYGHCGMAGTGVHAVPISGEGQPYQTDLTFPANYNTGFGFSFRVQKLDNSTGALSVAVTTDGLGGYTNSTAVPRGALDWGSCTIS